MNGLSFAAMCSRSCASPSRRVSQEYNRTSVVDLVALAAFATRMRKLQETWQTLGWTSDAYMIWAKEA
jgi:hypothetical protein